MKLRFPLIAFTLVLLIFTLFAAGSVMPQAQAASTIIAYDMVGSASLNLTSYTDDPAIPFSHPADGFTKYQRGVSSSIPYAVLDDSLTFPSDSLGIVQTGDTEEFFGATDTVNSDTGTRNVVATWVFDITGAPTPGLSIDIGAMGNFESSDFFTWTYSIDGGSEQTAFSSSVDESIEQTYTMESGKEVTYPDPMLAEGVLLSNSFQTIATPLSGPGSSLTLKLTMKLNGGDEAVVFRNIKIGDLPPNVTSTTPADGASGVAADTNIDVTFSKPVAVSGDWYEIDCQISGIVTGADSSSSTQDFSIDPDTDFADGEKCTVTIAADQVSGLSDPTDTMESDYVFEFVVYLPPSVCDDSATFIHEVQGPGFSSPLEGSMVAIEGVVVGDFQEDNQLRGFYIQEEKADFDNQKATSEGVFVYEYNPSVDVEVGQRVRVTGEVDEFNNFTEITDVEQIQICGIAGSKEYGTVNLRLPEKFDGQLEQYEGMYVNIPSTMTVAQNYFLGRYGQLTLTNGSRLYQPTNQALPGSVQAQTLADRNARSILFLDDGTTSSNLNPVSYLGGPPPIVLRGGDVVKNIVGVLEYSLINSSGGRDYRLHPTEEPEFINKNIRPESPDAVGGSLKVATMNVLNYFTTLDGSGPICGPLEDQYCRGADSPTEFVRQETKIVAALAGIDADIVGLVELENHPATASPDPVLQQLVSALNDSVGAGTYNFIDAGVIGTDVIKVGIIYKTSTVSPVGVSAILDDSVDPNFNEAYNRPVLAQTFEEIATGERVTVAVNHLKSKGSGCDAIGDPMDPNGQGNCNLTRQKAAAAEVAWLASDPTGSGDADFMIIGDLNSYAMEDPITTIVNAGYIDVAGKFDGNKAYSYTFDGLIGTLDYVLASNSLNDQLRRATIWHINTDEPAVINYDEDFNPPGYYSPDQFRASDHDPVIVGLQLK